MPLLTVILFRTNDLVTGLFTDTRNTSSLVEHLNALSSNALISCVVTNCFE